jgi:flagellar assembly factor FliW
VEYNAEHVFDFPEGLIGFEHLRKFIVINDAEAEPFRWLVSVEDEDISLPILDPKFIDPLYEAANSFPNGKTVAVIASLKEPLEDSTVNLRSPLLFDAVERTGKQVILENDRLPIQQRFIVEPQLVAGE